MAPNNILITGANGFVGRAVCAELLAENYAVMGAVRTGDHQAEGIKQIVVGSIDASTDWSEALRRADVVIHLAAVSMS